MKQTVLIGLGGTGSRTVNNVARLLREKNIGVNDGIVTCAVLDTNQDDNDKIRKTGTTIPVIPTCDNRNIDRYLQDYAHLDPKSWFPYSRALGDQTMIRGAGEMRYKSRLAFMDTMASGRIIDLQNAMEKVFHNKPGVPEQVRVMLVSSLSGGTGSGMFLQTALWLRQFFESRNCQVLIRGIFLLPDVFIRTVPNVRNNPRKILYHYGNAYAAIRELNALNKIIKGNWQPEQPIVIPNLFDSRNPPQSPLFDNAFFIDDVDANGAAFTSIGAYEKMAAQIVYMQLYAPMCSELLSVEDNLYRAFEKSREPVYGSSGTAKAVFPIEDALEYCALRAAQDSISQGWGRLDAEIKAMRDEEKAAERDGAVILNPVSVQNTFIRLFDEKAKKVGKEVGPGDKLFVTIKHDIFNETRVGTGKGDETTVSYKCKVEAFISMITELVQGSVEENGGCGQVLQIGEDLPDPEHPENFPSDLQKTLEGIREQEEDVVASVLNDFDENMQAYADSVLRAIAPLTMSEVGKENVNTLFGLFLKKDANDQLHFVHPIAARYLLYKLNREIAEGQSKLRPAEKRDTAIEGDTEQVSFDNPETRKKETMKEYWKQVGFFTSKKELQHFVKTYKLYNEENANLCRQYETEALMQLVLKTLKKRVEDLIKHMEDMFADFKELGEQLEKDVDANVKRNENDMEKTLYVFARREHKEALFESLGVDLTGRNEEMFAEILQAVYGKFCADHRPSAKENEPYADRRVIESFYESIVTSFKKLLKKDHKKALELDIITALHKEADYAYEKQRKEKIERGDDKGRGFGQAGESEKRDARHWEAVVACSKRLVNMSAPFLQAQPEAALADVSDIEGAMQDENNTLWMETASGKKLQMPIQTELMFWGYNPRLEEEFPEINEMLGTNSATAADEGYGRNELFCYSSIYGVKAEAIKKFNELGGGEYYEYYSAIIKTMLKDKSEVDTPHIDKTWHIHLPYISAAMQTKYTQDFYKTLWYAIAYGRLGVDAAGKYQISKKGHDAYGNETYSLEHLLENGKPISAADVKGLIAALRNYPDFEMSIAREMAEKFAADVADMTTYVGTGIIQGLLVEGDLNPISIIVKYAAAKDSDATVKDNMLGALRIITHELAVHYPKNRNEDMVKDASIRLLYRLYEKSGMATKKQHLKELVNEFKALKLISGSDADEATETVEDII